MDYIIPAMFFITAGYEAMSVRKLLLLEKGKIYRQSKKWKDVLRTLQDGIMICIQSKIVFYNRGLEEIMQANGSGEQLMMSTVSFGFDPRG